MRLLMIFLLTSNVIIFLNARCQLMKNTLHMGKKCNLNCTLAISYKAGMPSNEIIVAKNNTYKSRYPLYKDCRCHCMNPTWNRQYKQYAIEVIAVQSAHFHPVEHVATLVKVKNRKSNQISLILLGGQARFTPKITFAKDAFTNSGLREIVIKKFDKFILPENSLPKKLDNFYLDENNLVELPSAVLNTRIEQFFLFRGNSITTVAQKFQKALQNAKEIEFQQNGITAFPFWIFNITTLKDFNIERNPIQNLFLTPVEVEKIKNNYTQFGNSFGNFSSNCYGKIEAIRPIKGAAFTACVVTARNGAEKAPSYAADDGLSTGVIIGITCGGGFFVLALVGVFFFFSRKYATDGLYKSLHSPTATVNANETPVLGDDNELLAIYISGKNIKLIKKLSKGAYGEVWLATYNDENVAVKKLIIPEVSSSVESGLKYDKLTKSVKLFAEEIKLMSKLGHPRIVNLIGCGWSKLTDFFAIVEFVENGDLFDYLQDGNRANDNSFTWQSLKLQMALDILEGLIYLHTLVPKVIHRDLKSRNVLLDSEYRVKLTDFGTARELEFEDEKTMTGGLGTIYWMAPEVLAQERHYTELADIYSFGVIMTELDTLNIPYQNMSTTCVKGSADLSKSTNTSGAVSHLKIPHLVMSGQIRPNVSTECPAIITDLVKRCLSTIPTERPSAVLLFYELEQWKNSNFSSSQRGSIIASF